MPHMREALEAWRARLALRRCDVVGKDVHLEGAPFVANEGRIAIGDGVVLSSIPVRSHVVTGPHGHVTIGNRVRIAHGVSICSHAEIAIGEDTLLEPFAILLDVDFHEIGARGSVGEARPIHIGRNVRIGTGAVILRGAYIEDDVVVAPNSVVSRRIPQGATVAGVPARPMLRAS